MGEQKSTAPAGPTVLIAGANRGIGLELARQYAADGWQVIATAREPAAADALRGTGVEVLALDVTDAGSVAQLQTALEGRAIDVLVVNAGIQKLMWKLADIDADAFEQLLRVNTLGPVRVISALLSNLRAGQQQKIVSITSELASIADNTSGGFYGYRESKAALNMFTRSLAAELADEGFICVVLHPGWVKTDMGGPDATLDVKESVSGIRRVIDGLQAGDNGSYQTHAGKKLPW